MENKENIELYRRKLVTPIIPVEQVLLDFFSSHHQQSCCEDAWADFSPLSTSMEDIKNLEQVTEVSISTTPKMGVVIFFYNGTESFGEPTRIGVFIPCYSKNNGYYSDNLTLIIKLDGVETRIRIDNYVFE